VRTPAADRGAKERSLSAGPTFFLGAFVLADAFFLCGGALESYALSSESSGRLGAVASSGRERGGASDASAQR
jgi:uncharacterized membrane protein